MTRPSSAPSVRQSAASGIQHDVRPFSGGARPSSAAPARPSSAGPLPPQGTARPPPAAARPKELPLHIEDTGVEEIDASGGLVSNHRIPSRDGSKVAFADSQVAKRPDKEPPVMLPAVDDVEKDDVEEEDDLEMIQYGPKYPGVGAREPADFVKALSVMQATQFFGSMDTMFPDTCDRLAPKTMTQFVEQDAVLFRQGDPAVDCYLVVRGTLGVYISNDAVQKSPRMLMMSRAETARRKLMAEKEEGEVAVKKTCCKWLLEKLRSFDDSGARKKSKDSKAKLKEKEAMARKKSESEESVQAEDVCVVAIPDRWSTTEGGNSYTNQSKIGFKVVELKAGDMVGEFGVFASKPRTATIKAMGDCELLVTTRQAFESLFCSDAAADVSVADVIAKKIYFQKVPGFKEYGVGRLGDPHPSDLFEEQTFDEGHEFLSQGVISEPRIWVIKSGFVIFRRMSQPFPRKCFTNLQEWESRGESKTPQHWRRIDGGAAFCSLSSFTIPAREQFTVRAGGKVCVYAVEAADFDKLPDEILDTLLGHIANKTMKDLLGISPAFCSLRTTMQSPLQSQFAYKRSRGYRTPQGPDDVKVPPPPLPFGSMSSLEALTGSDITARRNIMMGYLDVSDDED